MGVAIFPVMLQCTSPFTTIIIPLLLFAFINTESAFSRILYNPSQSSLPLISPSLSLLYCYKFTLPSFPPSLPFLLSMAPNRSEMKLEPKLHKPPGLSMEGLQRTISDISSELSKEGVTVGVGGNGMLPAISEVEAATCECCGMSEECTAEYINRVREKFMGKLICGLCAEAVKEETEKNGGKREEGLKEHMNACARFNRIGRAYPALYQAEAIKEILKRTSSRGKSTSPRENPGGHRNGRSSSCIPAITREVCDPTMVK